MTTTPPRTVSARRREKHARAFLVPAVFVLVIVVMAPLVVSFFLSFADWMYLEEDRPTFTGFANYIEVFTDPQTLQPLLITLRYVVTTVSLQLALGLGIALLLMTKLRGLAVFRVFTLLPFMLSEVVVALMWRNMLQADNGVVNYLLSKIGVEPRVWVDADNAFNTIVMVEIWQHVPFAILVFMAALAGVRQDLVEAAKIDGAGYLRRLWHVVLPEIRPQIFVVLIFRVMFTLRVFAQPYVLTGGGPADLTKVLGIDIYQRAFRYYDLGTANALAWLLIVLTIGFVVLISVIRNRKEA